MRRIVGGMPITVVDDDLREIERRYALQAGDIDAELVRVRAALVVGVDAADRAEMMLGGLCVEAIGGELAFALGDPEISRG